MTPLSSLPIRLRLTLAFAAGLATVVAGLSVFVYSRAGSDLLDAVDAGLSSRAELLMSDLQQRGPGLLHIEQPLIDGDEVFAQVADSSGNILESSDSVARQRLLQAGVVLALARVPGQARFYDQRVPGIDNVTRVLGVAVAAPRGALVVLVGSSLQSRDDALAKLRISLAIGGPVAIVLIAAGAWLALAGALRPVERMRREAAAISASDAGRRLSLPPGRDEIGALGVTLNEMLDRIEAPVARERRLVDRASHELRTPLAIQRMDLDLALSGPQTAADLSAALRSVSAENAHLTRLTEDLLVLARARDGKLPVRRADITVPDLLAPVRRHFAQLTGIAEVSFHADADVVRADPVWLRQAIHNLVDNAVRHTPAGGHVEVRARAHDGGLVVLVEDTGPGFAADRAGRAFEPFAAGGAAGLGLTVVRAIAEAHGGQVSAGNRPDGGAQVTLTIPAR